MSEEEESSDSNAVLWALCCVVLVPIIYVLSIGPAVMIAETFDMPHEPFRLFYAPVLMLHEHTPLKEPLENYVEWWSLD